MRQIFLDTETTGLDPKTGDRIVEIGAVELMNHLPTGRTYHQYINPERPMPKEAFDVHGLGDDFLRDKPKFAQIVQDFVDFIGDDAKLVIHNAQFDMKFLNAELKWAGRAVMPYSRAVDTLEIARNKFPGAQNSLDALCRRFRIDNSNRTLHGALLDSELLAEVYLALRGGYDVAPVLGSAATDTLAFVGPPSLGAGATVAPACRPASAVAAPEEQPVLPKSGDLVTLPVTLGPRTDWFTPDMVRHFLAQEWLVTPQSSRVGIRLHGELPMTRPDANELPSEGTETGAIQIPHSGQPVLFLADHPLTGGYPVIATLLPRALDLAGQIPPGARIRFTAAAPFAIIDQTRPA